MKEYTSKQYLMIDIANQYGLNKLNFETRIFWVIDNEPKLEELAEDADDPYRYISAVMAYRDACAGLPIGHLVGLDAAASGIAIMGALTNCPITCANTGIIGTERKDVYHECTEKMAINLSTDIDVARKDVKQALMTSYYGSKAKPKEIFGEDTEELAAFYEASVAVAPGANILKEMLLNAWQPFELLHEWIMPDGFHVRIPVLQVVNKKIEIDELDHASIKIRYSDNIGSEEGLSLAANTIHAIDSQIIREMGRRCNYNQKQLLKVRKLLIDRNTILSNKIPFYEQLWRDHKFLSLVSIDHIDQYTINDYSAEYCLVLINLIDKCLTHPSFECVFIHDEYLCHPNYCNYIRQTCIDIMAELAESTIMDKILSTIQRIKMMIPKYSEDIPNLIRQSEYIIS